MNTLSYPDANGDPLTLWQSKIGGNPYFPKDMEYPIDRTDGLAMPLLIQINSDDSFYFFIEDAQLKNRDFSEVEFYFECM
ncbi:MAG: DUF1963 domain-containing protein [Nodularia sp. (in: Bacteria)]|nr:MAG: DUF1963 domain-containing protein [Nodularia sp. (in: cyanobacteria)]